MEKVANKGNETQSNIKQVSFSKPELEEVVKKLIKDFHQIMNSEVDKRVDKKIKGFISRISRSIVMAILSSPELDNILRKLIISSICERESKFDGRIVEESIEEIGSEQ